MFLKLILTIVLLQGLSLCARSQGLLRRLADKAGNTGTDIIIGRAKNKVDKTLDGKPAGKDKKTAVEKEEPAGQPEGKSQAESKSPTGPAKPVAAERQLASAQSRFDFVPGEKTILFDNFEQDVIGEFPLKWYTNGSGEIVKLENQQGRWLQFNSGGFLTPEMPITENFTMEFDVFVNLSTKSSAVLPGFSFELYDKGEKAKRLHGSSFNINNFLCVRNGFLQDKAVAKLDSRENEKTKILSEQIYLIGFQKNFGTVVHVALSVQKERLRLWYNQEKVMDMPGAVASPHNFNQVCFRGDKTREGYPGFYISNFRMASGVPDMRSKLLDEGKYVTNGILFDVNSDKVKPESYGIIREIANAIKEKQEVKIKIIGHTDSDGAADANLALSKKRAAAVRQILVSEFGISADQLTTDGLGASQPVSSNSSAAGKAENRRVEFVKL